MTFEEFKSTTRRLNDKRKSKITNSLGIRQAFLFLQRNKWFDIGRSLKESQFQQIIRKINTALAFELMEGRDIKFPKEMGSLELRKYEPFVGFKNNKLKVSYPIDWDATLKLWYEDKDAFQNKTLIRIPEKEIFKILYNRAHSDYNNKSFFEFTVNRDIKRILKKHIKQGRIDAFLR